MNNYIGIAIGCILAVVIGVNVFLGTGDGTFQGSMAKAFTATTTRIDSIK